MSRSKSLPSHNLDFITDVPEDSVVSATLFFKTNLMEHYQEFLLDRSKGAYRFKYEPKTYPGTHLQYYFIIETKNKIYGAPLNDDVLSKCGVIVNSND